MKALMVILFFHQSFILKSTLETECLCYDEFLDFICKAYIWKTFIYQGLTTNTLSLREKRHLVLI